MVSNESLKHGVQFHQLFVFLRLKCGFLFDSALFQTISFFFPPTRVHRLLILDILLNPEQILPVVDPVEPGSQQKDISFNIEQMGVYLFMSVVGYYPPRYEKDNFLGLFEKGDDFGVGLYSSQLLHPQLDTIEQLIFVVGFLAELYRSGITNYWPLIWNFYL